MKKIEWLIKGLFLLTLVIVAIVIFLFLKPLPMYVQVTSTLTRQNGEFILSDLGTNIIRISAGDTVFVSTNKNKFIMTVNSLDTINKNILLTPLGDVKINLENTNSNMIIKTKYKSSILNRFIKMYTKRLFSSQ